MVEKKTTQTEIVNASDYMPKTLDTLMQDTDRTYIVIDKIELDIENGNARLLIEKEWYFSASKYVVETLQYLMTNGCPVPFRIQLIRKESNKGFIYYDLRP